MPKQLDWDILHYNIDTGDNSTVYDPRNLDSIILVHICRKGLHKGNWHTCNYSPVSSDFRMTVKQFQKRQAVKNKSKNKLY